MSPPSASARRVRSALASPSATPTTIATSNAAITAESAHMHLVQSRNLLGGKAEFRA